MVTHPNLTALARRFDAPPVTRFAPSPTGYLHLGHVVNAIYVWGVARALGGRVLLRIEDHDRIRSRDTFERALLEDLAWLGFVPDAGLSPLLRQSDSPDVYRADLDRLRAAHNVYACECSRTEIGGERYDGRCRARGLTDAPGRGIRLELDPDPVAFEDALLGEVTQTPSRQCGDLLVRDRDGHWTYQFAVTVDDTRQRITLVIRGSDLASSTGRQIALARMLGRAVLPVFLHHPLLVDGTGEKLSKAAGDTGIRELRAAGIPAPDVIGMAAVRAGVLDRHRPVPAGEVSTLFMGGAGHGP